MRGNKSYEEPAGRGREGRELKIDVEEQDKAPATHKDNKSSTFHLFPHVSEGMQSQSPQQEGKFINT